MYRIVYSSQSSHPLTDGDLEQIIIASRRNNGREDLTGILIAHDDRFLQVLEGAKDRVTACFERISADPRHAHIRMLSSATVTERIFGKWQMGLTGTDALAPQCRRAALSLYDLPQILPTGTQGDDIAARLVRNFLMKFGLNANVDTSAVGSARETSLAPGLGEPPGQPTAARRSL